MTWIILLLGLIAVIAESYNDRHGETKKDKIRDAIWLTIFASSVSLIAYYLERVQPLKTISLLLGVRILIFDPCVNWFLKRYSENHKNINIWSYVGKKSRIDRIVSNINWKLRLTVRIALFGASLWWFLQ